MYQLKAKPEDFKVKENLDLKLKDKGKFLYFTLKKTKWTTLKAIDEIARKLKVHPKVFSTAGMKDKYGIATQYVSGFNLKLNDLKNINIKDIELTPLGYSDDRIKLGQLTSNTFEIVVRRLEKPLAKIQYFPNYYDDQRFGEVRPNTHLVGKKLLERDFEGAMKTYLCQPFETETRDYIEFRNNLEKNWGKFSGLEVPEGMFFERKVLSQLSKEKNWTKAFMVLPRQLLTLFVQAYQSKLFNDCLNIYIGENYSSYVEADYVLGKLAFPLDIKDPDLKIPIIGRDLRPCSRETDSIIKDIMKKELIKPSDFKSKLSFINSKSILRPAFAKLKNIEISNLEKDELSKNRFKQKVKFKIKKGSYATIAIKAMFALSKSRD